MFIDFCLDSYHSLMGQLKKRYVITNFRGYIIRYPDILEESPFLILRHDVDACLESALRIAEIEDGEFGISSTYFILHSSPFYNILDKESIKIIRKINELGHEIGFHYDCSLFDLVDDKEELLIKMIEVFEKLCDVEVSSISCHNPSLTAKDYFLDVPGIANAYAPEFIEDMLYVSDSTATWRKGALEKLFTPEQNPKVQLLLHPLYWNRKEYHNRKVILSEFRWKKFIEANNYFGMWEDVWDSYLVENEGALETE